MKYDFTARVNARGKVEFILELENGDRQTVEVEPAEILGRMRNSTPCTVLDYTRSWVLFSVSNFSALTGKQRVGLHTETANGDYWMPIDYFMTYFVPETITDHVAALIWNRANTARLDKQLAIAEDCDGNDY